MGCRICGGPFAVILSGKDLGDVSSGGSFVLIKVE
jgi:hypothetical protein